MNTTQLLKPHCQNIHVIAYNGAKLSKQSIFLLDVKEEIWTGLRNVNSPTLFQWSDGTEVTLTYWNENEPSVPYNKTPNCVSYLGKVGHLPRLIYSPFVRANNNNIVLGI